MPASARSLPLDCKFGQSADGIVIDPEAVSGGAVGQELIGREALPVSATAGCASFDIAVVTRKGEVQLSGFVDNQGQIDRAVEVARANEGVVSVINQMSIKK